MKQEKIQKWASMLVNHSLGKQFEKQFGENSLRGKMVIVEGEVCCELLMRAIEEEIIKAGGFPVLIPFFSNKNRRNPFSGLAALKYGNETQINFIPQPFIELAMMADAFITILGSDEPFVFENDLDGLKTLKLSGAKYDQKRFDKIWTLTLFPTRVEAEAEGMYYDEYCDFIVESSLADYVKMEKENESFVDAISKSDVIKIKTFYPKEKRLLEISMNKNNNLAWGLYGEINVPDGEILTSPYANTVEGEIFLDIPVLYGQMIGDVYLKFEGGKVVDFDAKDGYEALKRIIETDDGAKMIGELAFGINTRIDRKLRHVLFSEKIGGTIHLALGKSYDEPFPQLVGLYGLEKDMVRNELIESGVYVKSAQHVDIPMDFRNPKKGEGIFLDNKEVVWNGNVWKFKD